MADALESVLDAIATLQGTVSTPSGEKALTHAYDELPESLATYPCFVNVLREEDNFAYQSGARQRSSVTIDMYLCWQPGSGTYADSSRRVWRKAVLDKFGANSSFSGTAITSAIERIAYDEPLRLSETRSYPGIKFELRVTMLASTVELAV
ncbi:MAG: hypothetical protein E3J29_06665 [Dehalococcoidia bacterium]|nr:MAG: hypothetical protein E3J29_06665 [Dehalococcoidia bacterium]